MFGELNATGARRKPPNGPAAVLSEKNNAADTEHIEEAVELLPSITPRECRRRKRMD
jgi:hypothetical protein